MPLAPHGRGGVLARLATLLRSASTLRITSQWARVVAVLTDKPNLQVLIEVVP